MTKPQLLEELRNNPNLPDAFKSHWRTRIESEGLTAEVLDELRDAVQEEIDKQFAAAGVELDENDPEYQAQYKKMQDAIDAAERDYNATMDDLSQQAQALQEETGEKLDDLQAQAVKESI